MDAVGTQAEAAADEILRSEPRLKRWTKMTAQCWALYEGANRSLSHKGGAPAARGLIASYRAESALMAVIRLTALYDTDKKNVSFQTVYHLLKYRDVQDEIIKRYSENANGWLSPAPTAECKSWIIDYLESYRRVDWKSYGNLIQIRNIDVAHITLRLVERKITYNQMFDLLEIAMELQKTLSQMVSGGADNHLKLDTEDDIETNRRVLSALLKLKAIENDEGSDV